VRGGGEEIWDGGWRREGRRGAGEGGDRGGGGEGREWGIRREGKGWWEWGNGRWDRVRKGRV